VVVGVPLLWTVTLDFPITAKRDPRLGVPLDFLFVDADFKEHEGEDSWNEFVQSSESRIAAVFQCRNVGESRICVKSSWV
jgi:hypothetical protein